MKLQIDLPDTVQVDSETAKEMLVSFMYNQGVLSEKECCDLIGKTRREFEQVLAKYKIPPMGDSDEDIEMERNAYKDL